MATKASRLVVEARQILEVGVNEAGGSLGIEDLAAIRRLCRPRRDAMALQAAMDAAARQLWIYATPQDLDDIVERQSEALPQLDRQALLFGCEVGGQAMRPVGTVGDTVAAAPASNRSVAHPQLANEFAGGGFALLDVSPLGRRRCRQLVKPHHHDRLPRRPITKRIPATIPDRSCQSPGTEHFRQGGEILLAES